MDCPACSYFYNLLSEGDLDIEEFNSVFDENNDGFGRAKNLDLEARCPKCGAEFIIEDVHY